jgi:hypothetical protein
VADYSQEAEEKHARRIKKENEKFHPELKVLRMKWLERVEGLKDYAPLIVKIPYAKQTNRIIKKGVVIQYDLKLAEIYNLKCRVTQYYKCQRYSYIAPTCRNQRKCGHCDEDYNTEKCIKKE